jgi:hypothetical protein
MPPELPKYAWLTASTSVLAMIGQIASLICNVATFHAQRASLHVATLQSATWHGLRHSPCRC